eukprot:PhM_4_TR6226/c0_g1_i1/m.74754
MAIPYRRQRTDGTVAVLGLYFPARDKDAQHLLSATAQSSSGIAGRTLKNLPDHYTNARDHAKILFDEALATTDIAQCKNVARRLWEGYDASVMTCQTLQKQLEEREAQIARLHEALDTTSLVQTQTHTQLYSNVVEVKLPDKAKKKSIVDGEQKQEVDEGNAAAATATPTKEAASPSPTRPSPLPPTGKPPKTPSISVTRGAPSGIGLDAFGRQIAAKIEAPFAQRWARGAVTASEIEARYAQLDPTGSDAAALDSVVSFFQQLTSFGGLSSALNVEASIRRAIRKPHEACNMSPMRHRGGSGCNPEEDPMARAPAAAPMLSTSEALKPLTVSRDQFVLIALSFFESVSSR